MSSEATTWAWHANVTNPYGRLALLFLANRAGHDGQAHFQEGKDWEAAKEFIGLSDPELYQLLQGLGFAYGIDGRCGHHPDTDEFSCAYRFPVGGPDD